MLVPDEVEYRIGQRFGFPAVDNTPTEGVRLAVTSVGTKSAYVFWVYHLWKYTLSIYTVLRPSLAEMTIWAMWERAVNPLKSVS